MCLEPTIENNLCYQPITENTYCCQVDGIGYNITLRGTWYECWEHRLRLELALEHIKGFEE